MNHVTDANGAIRAKKICAFKTKEPPVGAPEVDFLTNGEGIVDFALRCRKVFHLST